jgi:alkyl sulfatase BDS1-like metallo-beta-lactamase superfamily hydrolase
MGRAPRTEARMSARNDPLAGAGPLGRVEAVAEGVAQFHGFCNVGFVWGRGAVLAVDTSHVRLAPRALAGLRERTPDPIALVVYTHGHVDHVGGAPAFLAEAERRGHPRPTIWAHEGLPARFARYLATWGWNDEVNRRQFRVPPDREAFPRELVAPDRTYRDAAVLDLAGERVELHHARGETDDATWVWLPERRLALVGDLSVQSVPNTGNPNKPQRYTLEWAQALEAIAARQPAHVIPGHGDPLHGEHAHEVLRETARALRFLHDAVLERMNAGQWPDEIVDAGIELPPDLASRPYLQPIYGCAAFVVRDVLRAYAGWWGGNPAELLPARRADVARDWVDAAGRERLLAKARALAAAREHRRALHLAVVLAQADAADTEAGALVAEVCDALAASEPSFIARNFYRTAAERARSGRSGA